MKTTAKVTRWLLSQDTGSYSDPIAVKQVLSFEKKLGAAVIGVRVEGRIEIRNRQSLLEILRSESHFKLSPKLVCRHPTRIARFSSNSSISPVLTLMLPPDNRPRTANLTM